MYMGDLFTIFRPKGIITKEYKHQNYKEELLGYEWFVYKRAIIFSANRLILKDNWGVHICRLNCTFCEMGIREYFFSDQSVDFNSCNRGCCSKMKRVWEEAYVFILERS